MKFILILKPRRKLFSFLRYVPVSKAKKEQNSKGVDKGAKFYVFYGSPSRPGLYICKMKST